VADREGKKPQRRRARSSQKWPQLEQQLIDARVVHGSALEQLIRDNQDFEMLHDHEASDTLGLPPWIRVYWRKAHPETEYRPDDPSGGYPLVLNRIYRWMLAHPDLKGED
jgi:hypothetical protein